MERGLPEGHVAAVEDGGDLVAESLLSEGVGLGVDPIRISEFGHGGDESGQCGVIPYGDGVVDGAVRVVLGLYRRKRRRCSRGGPRHREQNQKCVLCSVGSGVSFGLV